MGRIAKQRPLLQSYIDTLGQDALCGQVGGTAASQDMRCCTLVRAVAKCNIATLKINQMHCQHDYALLSIGFSCGSHTISFFFFSCVRKPIMYLSKTHNLEDWIL